LKSCRYEPFKEENPDHRRNDRRDVKAALVAGAEPPHPKIYGDPWKGDKDGKLYRDDARPRDLRK